MVIIKAIGKDFNMPKKYKYTPPLTITDLEKDVLFCLISELYAEPGFSDVGVSEIADKLEIAINKVKGVVGSLCKKKICFIDDDFENIVYLDRPFWNLHPVWKSEIKKSEIKIITNL